MLVCAIAFLPWVEPRETVSGFFGRLAVRGNWFGLAGEFVIDTFHWWEPDHCYVTYYLEDELRRKFYG